MVCDVGFEPGQRLPALRLEGPRQFGVGQRAVPLHFVEDGQIASAQVHA